MNVLAEVQLWKKNIGAVYLDDYDVAFFEYNSEFIQSGIEVSPLKMALSDKIYSFPELKKSSFLGLPGLLADSLPDKFGNALIDVWLASQGRGGESFNLIERLCYTGTRGMGALEFLPRLGPRSQKSDLLQIDKLTHLASLVLDDRTEFSSLLSLDKNEHAFRDILKVGTSAGGARAKAVIGWNRKTNEIRSGQLELPQGFEHWLLKFDGVSNNRDKELSDPHGFGAVEYAYSLMVKSAGIQMSECRLYEEGNRRHFMTRRFDRTEDGKKIHMQTLGALAHFDLNLSGAYSYEQIFLIMRQLGLGAEEMEQMYRRMVFNIISRNQDDHVKNFAFLMGRRGVWSLAPAYDITFSFNPTGDWTFQHQMSIVGERNNFSRDLLIDAGKNCGLLRGRPATILDEIIGTVNQWGHFAREADVPTKLWKSIAKLHRQF